jgi:hypothetical protein
MCWLKIVRATPELYSFSWGVYPLGPTNPKARKK